jgi:SAM-dependent methyltransferase
MPNRKQCKQLYQTRKLSEGFPNLDGLATEFFSGHLGIDAGRFERHMPLIERLVDLRALGNQALVIGCGPKPDMVRSLFQNGYDVSAVDVIPEYARLAGEYIGAPERVKAGRAEDLPYGDATQSVVFLDQVLEHVDSTEITVREIFRVLKPGGVCYIGTTNRLQFSPVGYNGEFRVPFFNWFPGLLQEAYVFQHLHYQPKLANFAPRPAVHWLTFAKLCRLGRQAGFAQFYSPLDLMDESDPRFARGLIRRVFRGLLPTIKYNPWLRAIALSQFGSIYMWKRGSS